MTESTDLPGGPTAGDPGAIPTGRSVSVVAGDHGIDDALEIRRHVFILEQGVPEYLEYDGLDAGATHFVCRIDGTAVATARVRFQGTTARIERVAVVADHRHRGTGRYLMGSVIAHVRTQGTTKITLASQTQARDFYRSLGFSPVGDEFDDAGIPHIAMVLSTAD